MVIPFYLELFGRPDTRRRIGERPPTMSALDVGDRLKVGFKVFDNRRRVSIRKVTHEGSPAWLLVAMPEGQNALDTPAAAAERAAWLREVGMG